MGLLVPALARDAARRARASEQALDLDVGAAVGAGAVPALVEPRGGRLELLQLRDVAVGVGRFHRIVPVGGVGPELLYERIAALPDGGGELDGLAAGEGHGFSLVEMVSARPRRPSFMW